MRSTPIPAYKQRRQDREEEAAYQRWKAERVALPELGIDGVIRPAADSVAKAARAAFDRAEARIRTLMEGGSL